MSSGKVKSCKDKENNEILGMTHSLVQEKALRSILKPSAVQYNDETVMPDVHQTNLSIGKASAMEMPHQVPRRSGRSRKPKKFSQWRYFP